MGYARYKAEPSYGFANDGNDGKLIGWQVIDRWHNLRVWTYRTGEAQTYNAIAAQHAAEQLARDLEQRNITHG